MAVEARSLEWHELRRQGIGASDVAAICGMSSYATPIDVYQQKLGLVEPTPDTPTMEWGRRLEPAVAEAFAERTGLAIRRRAREVRYRDWPVLFAHPDRVTVAGPLEVKTAISTRGWGEDGSAEVPPHVGLQVQTQLLCMDRPKGFVAALLGYRDFRVYEVERDDALLQGTVLPLLREFWTCVETQTPPEPDGSESYGKFLRRLYPSSPNDERPATPEEAQLVERLIGIVRNRKQIERDEAELTQQVQTAIGDAAGLLGDGWRVSWKQARGSIRTAWELVAKSLARAVDEETFANIRGLYTETKVGTRPFRITVEGED